MALLKSFNVHVYTIVRIKYATIEVMILQSSAPSKIKYEQKIKLATIMVNMIAVA